MKNEKNIPLKNYFILASVLLISIILIIYFYMWYVPYRDAKLNSPIMDKYLTVVNYNELENYLTENDTSVIYVSVLGDDRVKNFERNFSKFVNEYFLNNSILYLDVTSLIDNKKLFSDFKREYGISNLPCIISFRNGEISKIYDIKDNLFDMDSLYYFLVYEGVIND